MSILTPIDGGGVRASIQVFDHPADAYKRFECSCGGAVGITETPDFEEEMDWYTVMATCNACACRYLVIGIKDAAQMDEARAAAMGFFQGIHDGKKP